MVFFTKLAAFFRQAVALVLPVFASAGDFRRWNPWVWRILHLLCVAGVLALLWWVNVRYEVGYFLQAVPKDLRQFFLPTLFILLYLLSWLGYYLWRLLNEEEAAADFPDIDQAWREAVAKLDAAGIAPADAPLFLVLGRPAAGEDALMQSAAITSTVRAPREGPLRVYANRDAIYVTCGGASAWGRFAARLAGEAPEESSIARKADAGATVVFGASLGIAVELADEMRALLAARETRDLTPTEAARLRDLAEMTKGATPKRTAALSAEEQTRETARLAFLCRLIRRDRRPFCPVNGILLLVPWASTATDDAARAASGILHGDLAATRTALQLRAPIYGLLCDLETATGFAEFRRGFPEEMLTRSRIGQRLPLVPDVPAAEVPTIYEKVAQWLGSAVLPAGILKFLKADGQDAASKQANRNLYLLLREVYSRGPRLARVLSRGLAGDPAEGPDSVAQFGGCYLAGTGRQPTEQAFVAGVFQRLTESQSAVSWTAEALKDDAKMRRWAGYGYAAIAVALAAAVGLVVWARR